MKIAFIADVHIGNHRAAGGSHLLAMNARCRETLAAIKQAVWSAQQEGCDLLIILGDFFDTERPPPQMIAAAGEALAGIKVVAIPGNHDQVSSRAGDHALGWMNLSRNLEVTEGPDVLRTSGGSANAVFLVPFQAGDPKEWLAAAVAELAATRWNCKSATAGEEDLTDSTRALCIHLGLRDAATRKVEWAAAANDAVDVEWLDELCKDHGITHVFAGNWHNFAQWETSDVMMTQCGALVPTGWDNPGLTGYGGLIVFDTETGDVVRHEIPGPRFVKIYNEAGLHLLPNDRNKLYVRWVCEPEDAARAHASLEEAQAHKDHPVHAYDVEVDSTKVRAAAGMAARAATDRATLDDALTEYVTAIELPAGVDRPRVLNRCRGYLGLTSEGGSR